MSIVMLPPHRPSIASTSNNQFSSTVNIGIPLRPHGVTAPITKDVNQVLISYSIKCLKCFLKNKLFSVIWFQLSIKLFLLTISLVIIFIKNSGCKSYCFSTSR